jgi:hypothetical protein
MGLNRSVSEKKISEFFLGGIWSELQRDKTVPITAWITDIGNDLGYEVPVETILKWVSGSVDWLEERGARIAITDLPLEKLRGLGERKFRLLCVLFFPVSRLGRDELLARAAASNGTLNKLGETRTTPIFRVPNAWHGWDPIHPQRRCHLAIWREQLGQFAKVAPNTRPADDLWLMNSYLRLLKPESRSHFSVLRTARQPNGSLWDGTSV